MTELQAAIEAAGLPYPKWFEISWAVDQGHVEILGGEFMEGVLVRHWSKIEGDDEPVLLEQFETDCPDEACAQVRRWLDEQ